ncbi:hypothetical protein C8R44DRAFT_825574 [Mycena epipterygia]|nr:hypothetical protein C8R44DRAFT_825574 [Mycena epipterygia]
MAGIKDRMHDVEALGSYLLYRLNVLNPMSPAYLPRALVPWILTNPRNFESLVRRMGVVRKGTSPYFAKKAASCPRLPHSTLRILRCRGRQNYYARMGLLISSGRSAPTRYQVGMPIARPGEDGGLHRSMSMEPQDLGEHNVNANRPLREKQLSICSERCGMRLAAGGRFFNWTSG